MAVHDLELSMLIGKIVNGGYRVYMERRGNKSEQTFDTQEEIADAIEKQLSRLG